MATTPYAVGFRSLNGIEKGRFERIAGLINTLDEHTTFSAGAPNPSHHFWAITVDGQFTRPGLHGGNS